MHPVQSVKIKHPFFLVEQLILKKQPKKAHISIYQPPSAPTEVFYRKSFTVLTKVRLLLLNIVIWSYLSYYYSSHWSASYSFLLILTNYLSDKYFCYATLFKMNTVTQNWLVTRESW